jgi:hypothetical protein
MALSFASRSPDLGGMQLYWHGDCVNQGPTPDHEHVRGYIRYPTNRRRAPIDHENRLQMRTLEPTSSLTLPSKREDSTTLRDMALGIRLASWR